MTESIDRLLFNYSNARKSWEAWCFLGNLHLKNSNPEVKSYADQNDLLFHLRYLAFKDFHIELYKILKDSPRNKDNIFKLLRTRLMAITDDSGAKKALEDLLRHESAIKGIISVRDKYYAHLDGDYNDYVNDNGLINDLYACLELIEKSIIALTSIEHLMGNLDKIPSRNDFKLLVPRKKIKRVS